MEKLGDYIHEFIIKYFIVGFFVFMRLVVQSIKEFHICESITVDANTDEQTFYNNLKLFTTEYLINSPRKIRYWLRVCSNNLCGELRNLNLRQYFDFLNFL